MPKLLIVMFVLPAMALPIRTDRVSAGELDVTVERVIEDLRTKDIERIVRTLRITIVSGDQRHMRPFMLDLWHERRAKYPDLPWDIITSPQVKVQVARILAPLAKRGVTEVQPSEILDYAWSVTDSPDGDVLSAAFTTISKFERSEDIARMEQYLENAEQRSYNALFGAVWALARMCNEDAARVLDGLEGRLTDPRRREMLADTRRQWDEQRTRFNHCRYWSRR